MNNPPRRSARLSQLHQQQSSNNSLSSSLQSSSASLSSYPSPSQELSQQQQQDQLRLHLQSQYLAAPQQFNAPLPSPSANDYNPFIGYMQSPQTQFQMPQQSQQNVQQSHQQHGRTGSDNSQHQHTTTHNNSFSSQQRPNVSTGNNTGQLPPDFLAEAARRAQIACLMRDLGDVTL